MARPPFGLSTQIPHAEVARSQHLHSVPNCAEWCKDLEQVLSPNRRSRETRLGRQLAVAAHVWMRAPRREMALFAVRRCLTPDHQQKFLVPLRSSRATPPGRQGTGSPAFSHVSHAIFSLFLLACWAPRR